MSAIKKYQGDRVLFADIHEREDFVDAPIHLLINNYFAVLPNFQAVILSRTSLLIFQIKVKLRKESTAASSGKPMTISLMPVIVPAALSLIHI